MNECSVENEPITEVSTMTAITMPKNREIYRRVYVVGGFADGHILTTPEWVKSIDIGSGDACTEYKITKITFENGDEMWYAVPVAMTTREAMLLVWDGYVSALGENLL